MSDRTAPIRNDIVVSGRMSDKAFEVKLVDIENESVIEEFANFITAFSKEHELLVDLLDILATKYNKEPNWFPDCFINNALMNALDTVTIQLHGKSFGQCHDQKQTTFIAVRILFWCAFLAEKYQTKEVPEIYSEIV